MSWHSGGWPGLLPLLYSDREEDVQHCLGTLQRDHRGLLKCQEQGASGSLFLQNLAKLSPLKWRALEDLTDMLLPFGGMAPGDLKEAKEWSMQVWGGWGQSKVVEDSNKQVREQESLGSLNKTVSRCTAWAVQRGKEVIGSHRRQEVNPDDLGIPEDPGFQ
eukprot:7227006-Lingulodinium_polyedra.AAC.1